MNGPASGFRRRDVLAGLAVGAAGAAGVAAGEESRPSQVPTGECIADWPGVVENQVGLAGEEAVERGEIPDGGDLVLYVHGLFGDLDIIDVGGDQQAAGLRTALTERAVETPLVAVMWPATETMGDAVSAAKTFAPWLETRASDFDSLIVLAHSAGAELILEALTMLADTDVTVSSVGLLGGSPDPEAVCVDGAYATGITQSVEGKVYNYHSQGDEIICTGPPFAGEDYAAAGCAGSACEQTPDNFVDVAVTDRVKAHCNYFKPASLEYDGESAVPEIVDRQFGAARPPDGTLAGTVAGTGAVAGVVVAAVNADTGGTIETAIVDESGTFDLALPPGEYVVRVGDAGFETVERTVTVESESTASIDVALEFAPVTGDAPPRDLDGDGLYENVTGDGVFDIQDVQALFDNLETPAVQDNAGLFKFQENGIPEKVTILDVQALFNRLDQNSDRRD
jgi:PKD repeat protein